MKIFFLLRRLPLGLVLFLMVLKTFSQNLQGSFDSKFTRYQSGQAFAGTSSLQWSDIAWKGDRLYKQIVLWNSGTTSFNNISYTVSDLIQGTQTIPSSNIKLRFEQYANGDPEARSCSEYSTRANQPVVQIADALSAIPVSTLTTQDPIKIWVTVDIPSSAAVGTYTGTIQVKVNGTVQKTFNLGIQVVDKTLPAVSQWSFHLDLWQYPYQILKYYNENHPNSQIAVWSDQHLQLIKPEYKLLADMGQKAVTTHIKDQALGGPSMIKWTLKTNGTWNYDYSAFTKYVKFLRDSVGISGQINCFSLIGWNEDVIPYWDESSSTMKNLSAPVGSATFNTRWNDFLTSFRTYLISNGWFDKTVLFMDEIADDKMQQVITLIKNNNSSWKIGVAHVKELSSTVVNNLYDKSGSLALATGHTNPVSTFYTSCSESIPNNYLTPQNNPAEMSWMPWHALKESLDGYLRWSYDYWNSTNPFELRNGGNTAGDFAMIYRSSNELNAEIMSSIRLELLRDGIQDFEKNKILRNQLSASTDLFDQEALAALNTKINQFTKTNGTGAYPLVMQGQQLLKDIASGNYGVCKVGGGSYTSYYLSGASTTGAISNLNFTGGTYPTGGVSHHTSSFISARAGTSFSLILNSSSASNCARLKVWIDWNGDNDFQDTGEDIFTGGTFQSCSNPLNYTISITVPTGTSIGKKRMRVQLRDAWQALPVSCGINNFTETTDFDLFVSDIYCSASTQYNSGEYYLSKLETANACNGNISYNQSYTPLNGYDYYTNNNIKVKPGSSVMFSLQNSQTAVCGRTKAWIDWNRDGDFSDSGEEVFSAGIFQSCANLTKYSFNISVPSNAVSGITRMRVQIRDSWQDVPNACLTDGVSCTTDFNIEISNSLAACSPSINNPVPNTQLTNAVSTFSWTNNGTTPVSQWIFTTSYQDFGNVITNSQTLNGSTLSTQTSTLPTDGRPVTVTLGWQIGSNPVQQNTYNYFSSDRYCSVGGGNYKGYFIQNLTTSNAKTNINYFRDKYSEGGYEQFSSALITSYQGGTFSVNITTSLASYSALTKVWIDWNGNNIFEDSEVSFSGGTSQSGTNSNNYSFNVTVPNNAVNGLVRMRVQVCDAWKTPAACGIQNATSTTDFNIFVESFISATVCSGTTTLLSGTVLGSPGSFGNYGDVKEHVFDGNNNTWFDAPYPNGQWAGLDLGSTQNISCIMFRPRNGWPNRMRGGKFQISTGANFSNPVTIYTVPQDANLSFTDYYLTSIAQNGIPARYFRYLSPDGGYGNITEIKIYKKNISGARTDNLESETGSSKEIVFPNPTTSIVTISGLSEEINTMHIYSEEGKEMQLHRVETDKIDISNLSPGVYILVINNKQTYKIIKSE